MHCNDEAIRRVAGVSGFCSVAAEHDRSRAPQRYCQSAQGFTNVSANFHIHASRGHTTGGNHGAGSPTHNDSRDLRDGSRGHARGDLRDGDDGPGNHALGNHGSANEIHADGTANQLSRTVV